MLIVANVISLHGHYHVGSYHSYHSYDDHVSGE